MHVCMRVYVYSYMTVCVELSCLQHSMLVINYSLYRYMNDHMCGTLVLTAQHARKVGR